MKRVLAVCVSVFLFSMTSSADPTITGVVGELGGAVNIISLLFGLWDNLLGGIGIDELDKLPSSEIGRLASIASTTSSAEVFKATAEVTAAESEIARLQEEAERFREAMSLLKPESVLTTTSTELKNQAEKERLEAEVERLETERLRVLEEQSKLEEAERERKRIEEYRLRVTEIMVDLTSAISQKESFTGSAVEKTKLDTKILELKSAAKALG